MIVWLASVLSSALWLCRGSTQVAPREPDLHGALVTDDLGSRPASTWGTYPQDLK